MHTQAHIPVFYEGQDDLIEILATSMVSACYNTKSFIDFYILDCGIHMFNKMQLEFITKKFSNVSLEYIKIDISKFSDLKGYTNNNYVDCYSRLLIPELKQDIHKAIYLDADTIILDDIQKLYDIDLEKFEIGACPDLGYTFEIQNRCKKIGISDKQKYFNAGVLLINCDKWRENKVSKNVFNIAHLIKNDILYICEDILNINYNYNMYKILPMRYNMHQQVSTITDVCCPEITKNYLYIEWQNLCILHLSPAKPWIVGEYLNVDLKHWSNFWFFVKLTPFYEGLSLKFLNNSNKTMLNVNLQYISEVISISNHIARIKNLIKKFRDFLKIFKKFYK